MVDCAADEVDLIGFGLNIDVAAVFIATYKKLFQFFLETLEQFISSHFS